MLSNKDFRLTPQKSTLNRIDDEPLVDKISDKVMAMQSQSNQVWVSNEPIIIAQLAFHVFQFVHNKTANSYERPFFFLNDLLFGQFLIINNNQLSKTEKENKYGRKSIKFYMQKVCKLNISMIIYSPFRTYVT